MEDELRLTIFWIVHPILLGLFGIEMLTILSVWLKATVPGLPSDAPRWRKSLKAGGLACGLICSRRIWSLLKALVIDAVVHRRLFQSSRRRWVAHLSIFGSCLVLGALSGVTGFVVEILPLLGMSPEQVASIPLAGQLYHADVWWVALMNDFLGLLMMGGMGLVIYRRYVQKDAQLRTIPVDTIIIALLTLVALGGFLTETFRLLADYTVNGTFSPDPSMLSAEKYPLVLYDVWGPQWGFAGYLPAYLLGMLGLSSTVWHVFHHTFFWLHLAVAAALMFLMPFSRFFHVIMSPIVVAYNKMLAQERRGDRADLGRQTSQWEG